MIGEQFRRKTFGDTPNSSICCRSSRSKGDIRKINSTLSLKPESASRSSPAKSKKRNFSGKQKYSCNKRYAENERRGYGRSASSSENPTARSRSAERNIGDFLEFGARSRIAICVQLLNKSSYNE